MVEWLEQSYLESSVANNKFLSFLNLTKEFNADGDTFVGSFRDLLNDGSHKKGKNINLLEVVAMDYVFAEREDLQSFVQPIQYLSYVTLFYIFFNRSHLCDCRSGTIMVATFEIPFYVAPTF